MRNAECGSFAVWRMRGLIVCCHSKRAIVKIFSVIQREPEATEESPKWLHWGSDAHSQALLSFSRSARESPKWFCRGTTTVASLV